MTVHPDVEALLALQIEDEAIREIESRRAAFDPRLREMDGEQRSLNQAAARAREAVQAEEKTQRELQARVVQHKQLHERNVAQLDTVRKMKEATAAVAQVEQARRILAEEESTLQTLSRRLNELRAAAEVQERALADLESRHSTERGEIERARGDIETELRTRAAQRAGSAARVSRPLLQKYDRIRTARRGGAIYALRGPSCGHCDTSVPLQRRNIMAASGSIEVCETCGVLMYAVS
jgi:predicted  nucleic acid-binding Zn-ribbon protein